MIEPKHRLTGSDELVNKHKSDGLDETSSITSQKSTIEDENWIKVLHLCKQRNPIPFGLAFPSDHYNRLAPIDSGSYSLVSRGFDKSIKKDVVFKIINVVSSKITKKLYGVTFDGKELLSDVFTEIMVSKSLSNFHMTTVDPRGDEFEVHSFPRVVSIRLVQGSVPNYMLLKQTNDSMDKLDKIQLNREMPGTPREYLIMTLKYCGEPLWKVVNSRKVNAKQILSICYQLTLALTASECVYEFEHRDLHVGNILVKKTKKKSIKFVIKTQNYRVQSFGYKAFIIDTTFSRIKIGPNVFFTSLSNRLNPKIHQKDPEPQDIVYKRMAEEAKDNWECWRPQTNLYWLKYLYRTVSKCWVVCQQTKVKRVIQQLIHNIDHYHKLEDFIECINGIK